MMAAVPELCFEVEWPVLAKKLDIVLADKGLAKADREDIIQETGLRLLRMWQRVDPMRSPAPLAVTIALNLLRDGARKPHRECLGVVPDVVARDDVESAALARAELEEVARSISKMPDAYRIALLAEVGAHSLRPHKMVRMRARRALKQTMNRRALGLGAGLIRLRRGLEMMQGVVGTRGAVGSAAASLALFGVIAPYSSLVPPSGAADAPERQIVTQQAEMTGGGVVQEMLDARAGSRSVSNDRSSSRRSDAQRRRSGKHHGPGASSLLPLPNGESTAVDPAPLADDVMSGVDDPAGAGGAPVQIPVAPPQDAGEQSAAGQKVAAAKAALRALLRR